LAQAGQKLYVSLLGVIHRTASTENQDKTLLQQRPLLDQQPRNRTVPAVFLGAV
jgi:hypothetical protein